MQNPDWPNVIDGSSPTCGTFSIDKWRRSRDITLKKNRHNWNGCNVAIDKLELTFMENQFTALQIFEMGKIDWMEGNFASSDLIYAYQMTGHEHELSRSGTFFTIFNVNDEIFNNINMRKAFAYAIDRAAIADNISNEQIATRLVPPSFRHVESTIDYFAQASPQLALAYFEKGMEDLGLTKEEFPSFTYYYPEMSGQKQVAQALQNQWRECLGVNIELQGLEMKLFMARLFQREFSIAQSGIIAQYTDAMNFLERFQDKNDPKNYPGWENAVYNKKLQEAMLIPNPKLRQLKYDEAEAILLQEMPIAPVHHIQDYYLLDETVQGVEVAPNGVVDFRNVKVKRRTQTSP